MAVRNKSSDDSNAEEEEEMTNFGLQPFMYEPEPTSEHSSESSNSSDNDNSDDPNPMLPQTLNWYIFIENSNRDIKLIQV